VRRAETIDHRTATFEEDERGCGAWSASDSVMEHVRPTADPVPPITSSSVGRDRCPAQAEEDTGIALWASRT